MNGIANSRGNLQVDPPTDEVAERAVLGAMITEPERIGFVLEHIGEEDFYFSDHRAIFRAVCSLWDEKGSSWDDIVLSALLEKEGIKEPRLLIYNLVDEAATGALLEEALLRLKDLSHLRKLLDLSVMILRGVQEKQEVPQILSAIDSMVKEITERQPDQIRTIREVMSQVVEVVDRLIKSEKLITGLPSGFFTLDTLTAGFQEGDLVIIAARPGMGKTSFMLTIALHMALREKIPVAIFSLEMSDLQLGMRILSMLSGIPLHNIRRGFISQTDREKLVDTAIEVGKSPIFVDYSSSISIGELKLKARKLVKEKGVRAVFIDYMQLIRPSVKRSTRQEEVAEISRSLKALAKELSVPVVALAQLSRQVESRSDKRPQLSDLRESGQIEQDADTIIFIHRPEYYKRNPSTEEIGVAEIILAKQRQGPTGIVKVSFNKETTGFAPMGDAVPIQEEVEEDIDLTDLEDLDF